MWQFFARRLYFPTRAPKFFKILIFFSAKIVAQIFRKIFENVGKGQFNGQASDQYSHCEVVLVGGLAIWIVAI